MREKEEEKVRLFRLAWPIQKKGKIWRKMFLSANKFRWALLEEEKTAHSLKTGHKERAMREGPWGKDHDEMPNGWWSEKRVPRVYPRSFCCRPRILARSERKRWTCSSCSSINDAVILVAWKMGRKNFEAGKKTVMVRDAEKRMGRKKVLTDISGWWGWMYAPGLDLIFSGWPSGASSSGPVVWPGVLALYIAKARLISAALSETIPDAAITKIHKKNDWLAYARFLEQWKKIQKKYFNFLKNSKKIQKFFWKFF